MTGETASIPPSVEFVRPLDLQECITHTHLTHSTQLWIPLGEDNDGTIEKRYLPEEYYEEDDQQGYFELSSISNAIFDPRLIGQNVDTLMTDERSAELQRNAQESGKVWGSTIMTLADNHGLVQETTRDPAEAIGWVVHAADDGTPLLMVHTEDGMPLLVVRTEGRNLSIPLDAVYEREPEAVKESIRAYHRSKLLQNLSLRLRMVAGYHDISASDILPDFMQQIAALSPREQPMAQAEIFSLMTLFIQLNSNLSLETIDFKNSPFYKDNSYNRDVQDVLGHMALCPTQSDEVMRWSDTLAAFYERLSGMRHQGKPLGDLTEEQADYLSSAATYLPGRAENSASFHRSESAAKKAFADMIASTHETSSPQAFLSALEAFSPELFQSSEWLKNAVESASVAPGGFDRMMRSVVSWVLTSSQDINTEAHVREFERQLNSHSISGQPPSGVSRRGEFRGLEIQSGDFRTVVVLLVNKYARTYIEDKLTEETSVLRTHRQGQLEILKAIEEGLVHRYRDSEVRNMEYAEECIQANRVAEAARRSLEISDEDHAWLAQLWDAEVRMPLDMTLFHTVFYTLVAERQGLIEDMTSPIIKSFIKETLKDRHGVLSPKRERQLQQLELL